MPRWVLTLKGFDLKKKLLISLGVVFGVIAILVILLFTLFALHSVKVNFRTSTTDNMSSEEEIIEAGEFSYGMPVCFLSKKKFTENIEKACPYVDVVNIETVFPYTMIVHVKERQEVFALNIDNTTYYLDNTLKILRVEEGGNFISTNKNPILLTGLDIEAQELQVGQKIQDENYVDVFDSFVACNRNLYEQKEIIKSIEVSSFTDTNTQITSPCLTICTYDEHLYYLRNADKYLTQKVSKFLAVFSDFYSLLGQKVTNHEDSPTWDMDMLKSAYVIIDNYYIVENNSNPCYANVIPVA